MVVGPPASLRASEAAKKVLPYDAPALPYSLSASRARVASPRMPAQIEPKALNGANWFVGATDDSGMALCSPRAVTAAEVSKIAAGLPGPARLLTRKPAGTLSCLPFSMVNASWADA